MYFKNNTFLYIEDLYYIIINLHGNFKFKSLNSLISINKKLIIFVKLNYLIFNIYSNLKYLNSFMILLKNTITNSQFGRIDYLYLKGIGFKILNSINILFFKLNYSHFIYFILPLEMKVFLKKKNKLLKFSFFQYKLAINIINKIRLLRIVNIYTQKGIFKNNQLILKKEGKRKQL